MKNEYLIQSDRYGHTHKFVSTSRGSNPYVFYPEQDWMPLYCTYSDDAIVAVDTEGGPFMSAGWSNDEIVIERIEGGKTGPILFYLKEKAEE